MKQWDAMYDTGEHFPVKLNEIVQVTQQVYLLGMWNFVEGLEEKLHLKEKSHLIVVPRRDYDWGV